MNAHSEMCMAEGDRLTDGGGDRQRLTMMMLRDAECGNDVADEADRHVVVDQADRVWVPLEVAQSCERLEENRSGLRK